MVPVTKLLEQVDELDIMETMCSSIKFPLLEKFVEQNFGKTNYVALASEQLKVLQKEDMVRSGYRSIGYIQADQSA